MRRNFVLVTPASKRVKEMYFKISRVCYMTTGSFSSRRVFFSLSKSEFRAMSSEKTLFIAIFRFVTKLRRNSALRLYEMWFIKL